MNVRIIDINGQKLSLTQWDVDRVLYVEGCATKPMLHFWNDTLTRAIVVEPEADGSRWVCKVPNILLQHFMPIVVSVFIQEEDDEGKTVASFVLPVRPKAKPQDYTFEENIGYVNWVEKSEEAQELLDDIEDLRDEIQTAVDTATSASEAAVAAAEDIDETVAAALQAAKDNGEFDGATGADGSGVWFTTGRISGDDNPFVRRRDLTGREGATAQVHDLLFAPDVGDDGEPTTLYEITSVGAACALNRLCKMQGANGTDGASAYEIAVEHGYTGTVEEWLESLQGADAVVDPTLSNPGEAADAAETGKVKHTADYALTFAETLNSGAGIPLDAEWVVGDFGATRNYRAHSKRAVLNTSQCVLQAAAGYRFYVRTYSDGSYTDSSWYGPDYASRQTYTLPAGADVSVIVGAYPEDTSVTADPDVFGAAITIVNNIGSGGGGGGGITVDDALSGSSTNPVQNKVVKVALDGKYAKPAGGIPASDLAETYLTQHQDISGKLDKNQGTAHAGEFCVVGSDGNITTVSMTAWQGGSY